MAIVVECKDGVQLEVVARRHNAKRPKFTHQIELPEATGKRLAKALEAAYVASKGRK